MIFGIKRLFQIPILSLILLSLFGLPGWAEYHYPPARKVPVVERYHGIPVADPYRWLEEPTAPETTAWVGQQNQLTDSFLASPERPQILKRLETLHNYPRRGVPFRVGGYYYFWENTGLQNQSVLYRTPRLGEKAEVVMDPNSLSSDGTISVMQTHFTQDGKYLAYTLSRSGSDWQEAKIRDLELGQDLSDHLKNLKFSGLAWKKDKSGFYYNRFPTPGSVPETEQYLNNQVYFHALGTDQSQDQLIYANPQRPKMSFYPTMTEDGRYLLLYGNQGTESSNHLYFRDETQPNKGFIALFDQNDAEYSVIGNQGTVFYLSTNKDAPRSRIMALDTQTPKKAWQEIIPQQAEVLSMSVMVNQQLVLGYLKNAHHQLRLYSLAGKKVSDIALPTLGSIAGLNGRESDSEMFFGFSSFLFPTQAYHYDFATGKTQVIFPSGLDFKSEDYLTRQVFYPSRDGTQISMFLVHKKDLQRDGTHPTLLYGYGGFNLSLTPYFSPSQLLWLEQGGVYAVANLRGGGEYGEAWHEAGMLEKKQNVFDDFIYAARWLIENKYTHPQRLAIQGGSNGGLLTTATMLQRPDLFGAVISQVPVTDMLRYHKFTVGRYWIPEYGNAEENPTDFRFLYAYSPLHSISAPQAHPPILVTTAEQDDRVVPAHAYKFVARLQAASQGRSPVLLRVETKAGHGAGKPTAKRLEEGADIYAFLFKTLGMTWR